MKESHYFKTKLIKLGRWNMFPADTEGWHGEHTSLRYFSQVFGFNKCLLMILSLEDGSQYAYIPEYLLKKLYQYIEKTNRRDYKLLDKKLRKFYSEKKKIEKMIPKVMQRDIKKLSAKELIFLYKKNRDAAHRIAVYDQFGWLAEDYWNPIMEHILVKKYGIKKDSPDYFNTLFALAKPEEISTTLREKRDVLKSVLAIQNKKNTVEKSAVQLTKKYGWLPVFAFGEPWDSSHYEQELRVLIGQDNILLKKAYSNLKNYSSIHNREFNKVTEQYKMKKKDVQIFIDFGLALDTRNEAEYVQSFCGFHLRPLYFEIARRLFLSIRQLRCLYEDEIISCLEGKADPNFLLSQKGSLVAYGFNRSETKRINLSNGESKKLFTYLEKNTRLLHGQDEKKGLCASPGVVQGKVRIITTPMDNAKVELGDIMIVEATTVDYLPAMKRAGAMVTECGSLTCHAAVVSREFGIPCIVSLKNATKNFKDGTMVEVNASTGTIKVVS